MKKVNLVVILLIILLVFHKYFLPGPLVFGDAPYFYREGLKELLTFPTAWITRGNSIGGINLFLWIYPVMFIYGILGAFLHLNNDLILRILFYLPSLISALTGVYFLTKYLKLSTLVQFFAILIFLVNTYYLLIIDGGQVGIVLAYGLFPLVLLFLLKVVDKLSLKSFLIALLSSFLLTLIDFRISLICVLTAFLLKFFSGKKLFSLILVSICLLGSSSYWLIPSLKLAQNTISANISGLGNTTLLNSLTLFSSNWPANEFGKSIAPYFYFLILSALIFLPLFSKKDKNTIWLTFVFLIFAFLAKGASHPITLPYNLLLSTPIGIIFRDSTKFFIPLILIAAILIGIAFEEITKLFKSKYLKLTFISFSFLFILFLVWQAIFGKLNGVLGKNPDLGSYQKINNLINNQNGFLRDAWFIEKSPFAFHTETKQALDAKDLANLRPLASLNAGTGDRFNFINNKSYLDWFNLLGIKYLIFNGNPRVASLNESDQKDWNRLITLVENDARLQRLNLGTDFPIYENPQVRPNKFFVDKTFLVVGGDDVYEKLTALNKNFSVGNQGFLFSEDGKFDPSTLQDIASTSAIIIFNSKDKTDLKMSLLQTNFISPLKAIHSDWALKPAANYLEWKYDLLQNGIDTHEFDYNDGIAFSSKPNEKLVFNLNVPEDGNYFLEIRSMSSSGSGDLKANFANHNYEIKHKRPNQFEWFENGPITLPVGNYKLALENPLGFQVVSSISLIKDNQMNLANQLTQNFLGFFKHYDISNGQDSQKISEIISQDKWQNTSDALTGKTGWIIFTDNFNVNWSLQSIGRDVSPTYPMYSMINSFYVDSKWTDLKIVFKGNEDIRWGIYFSSLSLLLIIIGILFKLRKDK